MEDETVAAGPAVAEKRVMPAAPRGPAAHAVFLKGGRGEMTKAPISLQDLRRRLYIKAKTEPTWRFWGLYVHVCKWEALREAYRHAKANDGAPGIDGMTFAAVKPKALRDFSISSDRSWCDGHDPLTDPPTGATPASQAAAGLSKS
jgi:hypothetical protein